VAVLQGYAGTGKSSLLAAAKQAWEKSGFQVVGAAYSGRAAEELQNASGIRSHTVDRLLFQWAKSQSRVRPLDQKTILVVDEAGMLDSVKYGQLLGYVEKSGAKLVLVGDEKQLPPIGSASRFTELGAVLGRGELTEIRRQRNPLLRMVVEEMADGSPRAALKLLQRDKLLRLSDTPEQVRHQLVQDWFRSGDPKSSLMLAVTREDARDLNLRAQTLRKNHGQLGFGFFSHNDFTFHMGDRVLFRRNDRLLGVVNGSQGELVAFEPFKRIATFQLDNGKKVFVPVDRYRDLELAYCRTTFSAQGATVDNTFILWNPEAQSREGTYVQASRSRFRSQFYLTHAEAGHDFKAAIQAMEKSVAKDLAITKAREHGKDLSPSL
jgi:ATP-dependent exoDNAse (exonuclease V) alpha subunit